MRNSLSLKINLIIILIVLTLGSALAVLYFLDQKEMLQQEHAKKIEILGSSISRDFSEAVYRHDLQEMNRILEDSVQDSEISYVMAKSIDGEILATRWTAQTRGGVQEYSFPLQMRSQARSQSDDLFGLAQSNQYNQMLGELTIGVSLNQQRALQQRLIMQSISSLLLAIVLSLIIGMWLVRSLFKRAIKPLLTGIEAVGTGDLDQRIPQGKYEEIGIIAVAFNEMADRLSTTLISKERLEAAVQQRTADLTDREEQIRLLLDSTAEAIYGMDLNGNCTFSNKACLRLLGYARSEDLIGKNMHSLIHHTKDDDSPHDINECMLYAASRTGKEHHSPNDTFWKADGSKMHIEYWSYPVFKAEKHIGTVVTFLDITDKVKLERQLLHSQKMEAIGLLAGGVAHDFNNILTAIIGYGHLLQLSNAAEDERRPYVEQILTSAERAAQLTRGLLAFSRKQTLQMVPVRLNEIIVRQEKFLRMIIGEDIEMKTILRQDSAVIADIGQIEQILMNLATNARDAMPRGGCLTFETDRISMTESFTNAHGFGRPGAYAIISVTDSGIGMDDDTQRKIFDPFFTTKEVGRGTGLGMSIIYGIVKQHNGYITVYSHLGKGTTFKIYLPIHNTQVNQRSAQTQPLPLVRGNETILLAEDDPTLRTFFLDVLNECGYTVIVAENGQDALDKFAAQKDKIQLVILDMIMPKMSGREVFDSISNIRPDIKTVFTSGYAADKIHQDGLPSDCAFIAKPITPQDYLVKIRKVLDS